MAHEWSFVWRRLFSEIVGALWGVLIVGATLPAAAQLSLGAGSNQDQNAPIVFRADEVEYDERYLWD